MNNLDVAINKTSVDDYIAAIYSLRQLDKLKKDVLSCVNYGTISLADITRQIEMLETQEIKLKRQLINQIHVTKGGTPRKIVYNESSGLWMTLMPGKTRVCATTESGLYDKLLQTYGIKLRDMTIKGVFEAALDEKARTENNNESTISHYRFDYNRFISSEFGTRDITKVSKADLKEYIQTLVNTLHPKKKAFLQYKSVLNLIFGYAIEYDIITVNPVMAIKNAVYLKSCDTKTAVSEDKILSEQEIELLKAAVRQRMKHSRYHGYFINGYAILLSIETGMRAAELPALKWSDIHDDHIHIHAQQLQHVRKGYTEYYYADWTKNEKGVSQDGRKYPLTDAIYDLLCELRTLQTEMGIKSEFIFCHEDGEWIKTDAYDTCLRRLMKSLSLPVTNNHAFRMSLNSNVFINRCDMPATERARLLGHSVETNLRYYSYASKDSLNDLKALLNEHSGQVAPWCHQNVINFQNRKSSEPAKFQAFQ